MNDPLQATTGADQTIGYRHLSSQKRSFGFLPRPCRRSLSFKAPESGRKNVMNEWRELRGGKGGLNVEFGVAAAKERLSRSRSISDGHANRSFEALATI